ncbi:MAG: NAD-dependent DNA ligase LigA, partial [Kiritimatiellae bacterium]|nr:NAD-dependent DNA ligase LigA [Kiritimatiellia bacterium]
AERLGGELEGLTVLFTGTSSRFSREGVRIFLESHGAKFATSVTRKTSYVVTGEAPGDSKLRKAVSLGIPVIAEADFCAKFGL